MARSYVGGVTPAKGGKRTLRGLPVFDTVAEASERKLALTSRWSSCRRRSPRTQSWKPIDAEIELAVCITEGIPVLDMVKVKRALDGVQHAACGPELPGRHHPGRMQDRHHAGAHP